MEPPPTAPSVPTADKRQLYGDPGLVPSREGERVRRELALAGEIVATLHAAGTFEALHVDVELPARDHARPQVTVAGRPGPTGSGLSEGAVTTLVTGIVGEQAEIAMVMPRTSSPPPSPSPRGTNLDPWMAAALLGLGISLGIAWERLRRKASRRG